VGLSARKTPSAAAAGDLRSEHNGYPNLRPNHKTVIWWPLIQPLSNRDWEGAVRIVAIDATRSLGHNKEVSRRLFFRVTDS
jgi:hypothetical protein